MSAPWRTQPPSSTTAARRSSPQPLPCGRQIYAANNLFKGIAKYSNTGGALLGGVIANSINAQYARDLVDDFVGRTRTQVVEYVPRSITVTQAELQGKTTIEAAPESEQARIYRRLAQRIVEHTESKTPSPLGEKGLRAWAERWADQLLAAG
jgi:nitrogenase iron protein NifH